MVSVVRQEICLFLQSPAASLAERVLRQCFAMYSFCRGTVDELLRSIMGDRGYEYRGGWRTARELVGEVERSIRKRMLQNATSRSLAEAGVRGELASVFGELFTAWMDLMGWEPCRLDGSGG